MKKFFLLILLSGFLLGGVAHAETSVADTNAAYIRALRELMNLLLQQVADLQAQLKKMHAGVQSSVSTPTPPIVSSPTSSLAIISVTPNAVPIGYTGTITVEGSGFGEGSVIELGEGKLSTVGAITATHMSAQYPSGWNPGVYGVSVSNSHGTRVTLPSAFAIQASATQSSNESASAPSSDSSDVYATSSPWWWSANLILYTGASEASSVTYTIKKAPNGMDYLYANHTFWIPVSKLRDFLTECFNSHQYEQVGRWDYSYQDFAYLAILNAVRSSQFPNLTLTVSLTSDTNYIQFVQNPSIAAVLPALGQANKLIFGTNEDQSAENQTKYLTYPSGGGLPIQYPILCKSIPGFSIAPTLWQ